MNYEYIIDNVLAQLVGETIITNGSISDEELYFGKLLANRIKVELLQSK